MKRNEQHAINKKAINRLIAIVTLEKSWRRSSYTSMVFTLNLEGFTTSRGNDWTNKRLFRMLQRNKISGLHGLQHKTLVV